MALVAWRVTLDLTLEMEQMYDDPDFWDYTKLLDLNTGLDESIRVVGCEITRSDYQSKYKVTE